MEINIIQLKNGKYAIQKKVNGFWKDRKYFLVENVNYMDYLMYKDGIINHTPSLEHLRDPNKYYFDSYTISDGEICFNNDFRWNLVLNFNTEQEALNFYHNYEKLKIEFQIQTEKFNDSQRLY